MLLTDIIRLILSEITKTIGLISANCFINCLHPTFFNAIGTKTAKLVPNASYRKLGLTRKY